MNVRSPDNADDFDVTFNARIITKVIRKEEGKVKIVLNDATGTEIPAERVANEPAEITVGPPGQRKTCKVRIEVFAAIIPQPEKFPKSDEFTTGVTLKDVLPGANAKEKVPQQSVFATPIVMVVRGADNLKQAGTSQVFTKYRYTIERTTPVCVEPKKKPKATKNLPQFDESKNLTGDVLKQIAAEDKSWIYIDAPAVANVQIKVDDVGYLLAADVNSGVKDGEVFRYEREFATYFKGDCEGEKGVELFKVKWSNKFTIRVKKNVGDVRGTVEFLKAQLAVTKNPSGVALDDRDTATGVFTSAPGNLEIVKCD